MKHFRTFLLPFMAILLSACSFSLAGDVTPPPGSRQEFSTPTPEASQEVFPIAAPDLQSGQAIYAEKCAACHGDSGAGDGPQGSQLPNPPSPIGSASLVRQSTPADWFNIITRGNMDAYMPPFTSLSESQRWDVIAYIYSLSASSDSVARGKELYTSECADCHGEKGDGGPHAGSFPSFSDPAFMSSQSNQNLFTAVSDGVSPNMPAYGDQFSEAERWDITNYLRSLSFKPTGEQTAQTGAAETPEATPVTGEGPSVEVTGTVTATNQVGTVTGQVVQGSGQPLPDGMTVTLHAFDGMSVVMTDTTKLDPTGVFTFTNVEMPPDRAFLAIAEMDGATYASNVAQAQAGTKELSLNITTYETTTDTSLLSIDRLHIFFDFSNPGKVQVAEFYIISNPSDKTVVPEKQGGPVLQFHLPDGATNLQFQDGALGDRYLQTEDGFADTYSITPNQGEYQVLFAFDMPYTSKLNLAQPLNLPVNGVVVMLPEIGVKVHGDNLKDEGIQAVQGTDYHTYSYTGTGLAAGDELKLNVSGRVGGGTSILNLAGSKSSLAIGLGAFGVVLLASGLWLYRRSRIIPLEDDLEEAEFEDLPEESDDPEALMDAIIALDDLYKEGKLPEDAYQARRAELKEQLKQTNERK